VQRRFLGASPSAGERRSEALRSCAGSKKFFSGDCWFRKRRLGRSLRGTDGHWGRSGPARGTGRLLTFYGLFNRDRFGRLRLGRCFGDAGSGLRLRRQQSEMASQPVGDIVIE